MPCIWLPSSRCVGTYFSLLHFKNPLACCQKSITVGEIGHVGTTYIKLKAISLPNVLKERVNVRTRLCLMLLLTLNNEPSKTQGIVLVDIPAGAHF